ncbi:hypothetical protein H696_01201 [Fonticula alba]|uniref:Ribosome biogenesis protein SLX9 n=1 Tax=Fonticula alba TaxID=691883 RepID=A0A058ZBK7_FONAL|nr:hypothetical protein H696_01201 [Fonticula alba]KCV71784.1 hypothetical protein H696_01201 [Fonticula alba]|eukprot:XP_009493362.1 hypothetical protein H696_01201 [Fonticula alba]
MAKNIRAKVAKRFGAAPAAAASTPAPLPRLAASRPTSAAARPARRTGGLKAASRPRLGLAGKSLPAWGGPGLDASDSDSDSDSDQEGVPMQEQMPVWGGGMTLVTHQAPAPEDSAAGAGAGTGNGTAVARDGRLRMDFVMRAARSEKAARKAASMQRAQPGVISTDLLAAAAVSGTGVHVPKAAVDTRALALGKAFHLAKQTGEVAGAHLRVDSAAGRVAGGKAPTASGAPSPSAPAAGEAPAASTGPRHLSSSKASRRKARAAAWSDHLEKSQKLFEAEKKAKSAAKATSGRTGLTRGLGRELQSSLKEAMVSSEDPARPTAGASKAPKAGKASAARGGQAPASGPVSQTNRVTSRGGRRNVAQQELAHFRAVLAHSAFKAPAPAAPGTSAASASSTVPGVGTPNLSNAFEAIQMHLSTLIQQEKL